MHLSMYFWRILTLFSTIILSRYVITSLDCPSKCYCHGNKVDCIGANLTSIPTNLPKHTKYLYLNNNNIQRLESLPLQQLKTLTHLYLHDNQLSQIDENTFNALPQLSVLHLQRNNLRSLSPGIFSGASSLHDLNLSRNKLSDIYGTFKNVSSLHNLYISENSIQHLDENSFPDLVNLNVLELSKNFLKGLNLMALKNLKNLSVLKVDQNNIGDISTPLPDDIPLQMMDLSRCELRKFPLHIPKHIQYLNLGMNKLTSVTIDNLKKLTSLKILILDNNRIRDIEPKAFGILTNLQELWLNHNAITHLNIYPPTSLTSLVLDNNKIKKIAFNIFPDDSALQSISLQSNSLANISEHAFAGLYNLKELILDNNPLSSIQDFAFSKLPKLEILSLSSCPLRVIEKDAFHGLTYLKKLYIMFVKEPVTKIENFGVNLPSLEIFDIQSSPTLIDLIINSESFLLTLNQTATYLQEFNIMNGDLMTLPTYVRTYLSGVNVIKLAGNLWLCDEEINIFFEWLVTEADKFTQKDKITCLYPKSLKGVPIYNLTTEQVEQLPDLRKSKQDGFFNYLYKQEERIIVKDMDETTNNELIYIINGAVKYCPDNNEPIVTTSKDYLLSGGTTDTLQFTRNIIEFASKDSNYMERNRSKINNNHKSGSEQSKNSPNGRVAKSDQHLTHTKTNNKPTLQGKRVDFTSDISTHLLRTRIFNKENQLPDITVKRTITTTTSTTTTTMSILPTPSYLKVWASTASVITMGISLATGSLFYFVLRFRRRKSQSRNIEQYSM